MIPYFPSLMVELDPISAAKHGLPPGSTLMDLCSQLLVNYINHMLQCKSCCKTSVPNMVTHSHGLQCLNMAAAAWCAHHGWDTSASDMVVSILVGNTGEGPCCNHHKTTGGGPTTNDASTSTSDFYRPLPTSAHVPDTDGPRVARVAPVRRPVLVPLPDSDSD